MSLRSGSFWKSSGTGVGREGGGVQRSFAALKEDVATRIHN